MSEGVPAAIDAAASNVTAGLDRLFQPVGPDDVFSAPIERDGMIIVTAAAVERAGGFGFGGGDGAEVESTSGGGGGGGGGGGAVNARPVAVIKIAEDGVTVVPILDMTRIAIARRTEVSASHSTSMRRSGSRAKTLTQPLA